ncbi:MAG TPA: hypothetical protein VGF55_00805 [Gemmataceae bacterium]|jgi:hypothetical protein
MSTSAWVDPRVGSVRVADVVNYLTGRGWKTRPYPRPELLVFEGPPGEGGEPIVQVLPSSESLLDYRMRVEELIAALSVLEDRPAADVLADMLAGANGQPANGPDRDRGAAVRA